MMRYKGIVSLMSVLVLFVNWSYGQSPTPYLMSSGNKTWDLAGSWTVSGSTYTGTDAANWGSVGIIGSGTSVTTGDRTTKSSATIVTGVNGGFQKPAGVIQFLSTGSSGTPEAVAVDLFLDFTGRVAGTLSFDWAAIDNSGTRPTSLRVFWSIDGTTFTEITAAQQLDRESATSPSSGSVTNVSLPSAFDGVSTARLRFYNHAGSNSIGSGTRDKFQIDNIAVTSTAGVSNPTVNLSISSSSGTEAAQTSFTITATASAPVVGNQTVNYTISGTGITSSDFVGSPSLTGTITILNGQTSGTATFQVNDDVAVEGTETATITISSPSAGLTLGSPTSVTFTIVDNDLIYAIVTSSLIPNFICPGGSVSVPFTVNTAAGAGNVFTAQLSNASGSFASPMTIGTLTSTTSGSITATIPSSTPNGSGYRIRVVGSNPATVGTDNAIDITIQMNAISVLFAESMGTAPTTTLVTNHEINNSFDNDGYTMSGNTDVRNTSASSGYTGASGLGNVYFSTAAGARTFEIAGINTLGFSPMVLTFGLRNDNSTNGADFILEVSVDGSTYYALPWGTIPTTSGWYKITLAGAVPQAANVRLRFTRSAATTNAYRLDDVVLSYGAPIVPTVSPVGPVSQCGGTVNLTASPVGLAYQWTGGSTNQSLAVGSSGSYSVTVTDGFACQAVLGPVSVTISVPTTPTVAITPTSACAGSVVLFTATPSMAGTLVWKLNGSVVATGVSTYLSPALVSLDKVECELTIAPGCYTTTTVVSNPVFASPFAMGTSLLFNETFGTTAAAGGTALASYVGYSTTNTYTGTGDVRTTGIVSPLSGSSHVFLTNSGTASMTISGINTTTAFPNTLQFQLHKNINNQNGSSLLIEYSIDGVNFHEVDLTSQPIALTTGTGSVGWYAVMLTNLLPPASNLRLRFTNKSTLGNDFFRIDDISITGYIAATPTISVGGATTFCAGGSVSLTALPAGANYTWSNGANTQTINPTTSGTYTVTINDAVGCSGVPNSPVVVNAKSCWVGNTTDWNTAGNWSSNAVPNSCATTVFIPTSPSGGSFPTISSGTFNVGDIEIESNATVTINGTASLKVCGELKGGNTNNAALLGTSSSGVVLEGTAEQKIAGKLSIDRLRLNNLLGAAMQPGAELRLNKALELQKGTFTTSGQNVVFSSTSANQCAILDNFSFTGVNEPGTLSGVVTVERFVPVGGVNQHYFGSPITNTTFAQLGASGTSGFVIPSPNCDETQSAVNSPYGSVFEWHDNIAANATCLFNGWEVKTSGVAQTAKGYSVYLPYGVTTLSGNINQATSYSVGGLNNIGWSSNTLQTAGFSPAAYNSGWHLVANPFLSPIQLDGHTPDFDDAQVWVTTGPYSGSFQPVSIAGGTIAPFQGFIVHRSAASAATFTFNRNECVTTANVPFYKNASEHALSLKVSGNNFNDITRVEFNSATTNGFDVNYDSRKSLSAKGQPTLASFNSNVNERLSININRSIEETPTVALNFIPGANGVFTFNADGINTFDPTTYITLEDKKTGTMHDFRQNNSYTFTASVADNHHRFVLHFTPKAAIQAADATCQSNGQITIEQPGTASWNYTITDNATNATMAQGTLNSSNPVVVAAPNGTYQISLTDNNGYQVVKNVQVNGQTPIAATMTATTTTAEVDETITLSNTTTGATNQTWDMGNSVQFSTPNVSYSYPTEGVYTVTLSTINADGCQSSTSQTITVTQKTVNSLSHTEKDKLKVWSYDNKVMVDFTKQPGDAVVIIYNLLGQEISHEPYTANGIYSKALNNNEASYVVIRITQDDKITTKKLFIRND